MRLTKKKAIEISIELWGWLAEDGSRLKGAWLGWSKYGRMQADCPLCEYDKRKSNRHCACRYCPYCERYDTCMRGAYWDWWVAIEAGEAKSAKRYAKEFLEQLRQLLPKEAP